jgi:hypothetical protein
MTILKSFMANQTIEKKKVSSSPDRVIPNYRGWNHREAMRSYDFYKIITKDQSTCF